MRTPCTINHAALKADKHAWASLKFVGIQDEGTEFAAELRNCSCCNSTLAIELVEQKAVS